MNDINLSKIKRLDGALLLVFRDLMRHRRTTLVAERLGLTQSAISHALGRLRPHTDDFVVERLYEEEYCVVARNDHPCVQGAIDLATFSELGHVIISLTGELEQWGDNALKRDHIERRVVAAVPRFLTAFTLIAQSDAILTVQRRLAVRYSKAFQLQVCKPPFATQPFPVVVVRSQRESSDAAIQWLIEKVRQSAHVE